MNFLTHPTLIIFVVVVSIIGYLYSNNLKLNRLLDDKIIENKLMEQNHLAYQDSINQIPDSLLYYRLFVRELNNEMTISHNQSNSMMTILHNRITVLEDSIRFYINRTDTLYTANEGTDSLSHTIIIEEENDIVKVDGTATIFSILGYGTYDINIINKELMIETFIDVEKDSIITANTKINDGRLIRSTASISPTLYKRLVRETTSMEEVKKFSYGLSFYVLTEDFDDYIINPEMFINYNLFDFNDKDIKITFRSGFLRFSYISLGASIVF